MKLNNKEAKRKYGLTQFVDGAGMSTAGYTRGIGWAYVFDVDGYKVVKNVYFDGRKDFIVSGKNITESVTLNVLDMIEVEKINEKLRVELLSEIMKSDLTRVKKIMTINKKGFTFFMEGLIKKGLSKDLSFGNVVRDYYSDDFDYCTDTKAIIKVMVKYGYNFTNMLETDKLIR